jgi:hypothetical protein
MVRIPQRQPIGDAFTGCVLTCDGVHLLAESPLPGADVLATGAFMVRYGARYLGKPHLSVVPGIIALDYGDMLTGEDAWTFLYKRSNLHPRADVVGYRNDGTDEMINVKYLDLALAPEVLVYADADAAVPLARPVALIAADPAAVPARLLENLPRFTSLEDWRLHQASERPE